MRKEGREADLPAMSYVVCAIGLSEFSVNFLRQTDQSSQTYHTAGGRLLRDTAGVPPLSPSIPSFLNAPQL